MDRNELELLKDMPVLEGELEWVIKVIDSPPESITSVIRQLSSKNDTTE